MSESYLLDTNAIIAMMNSNPKIAPILLGATIYLPLIGTGELYFGAQNSARIAENLKRVEEVRVKYTVLDCNYETARLYGEISAGLSKKGRPIQQNDIWIAALALQYDLTVLTQDKGFEYIDTLKRKTW